MEDMPLRHDFLSLSVQFVSSLPAVIIISIVGCLIFLLYFTTPKYTPLEPPPLPHLLPFVGHAFSFVRDQRAFFERANKKTNGQPFSMLIAGDKLYIFHRPDDVSLIFRKSSSLRETRTDQKNFRINILGFSEHDASKIADLRVYERQIHTAHLLAAEVLDRMMARYFEELDRELDSLDRELGREINGRGPERSGFELVGDVLMRATVKALFGRDSFAGYPGLFQDLRQFLSEHFFERMIGLPDFFARGAVNARERIKKHLAGVVASINEGEDVSEYILERIQKLGKLGLSPEGIVSNEFDIILGSNLNSIPITYLSLLHILTHSISSDSPPLLTSILTELHLANWTQLSPLSRAKLVPTGLPRLHAVVREVLRFHTTAWSAREVTETTTLELKSLDGSDVPRVYKLQKGAIVAMPSSLLHHDAAVHANPETFDAGRFLTKELGGLGMPVTSATLRPFGGGISYCPGRLFAEKQVVGFLAGTLGRFEIEAKGRVKIPRNADFFYVTAQRDVDVVVRRRCREVEMVRGGEKQ